ncbi:signal recognition particle receptor subunit beta-like protein [Tanacetum coccineum]
MPNGLPGPYAIGLEVYLFHSSDIEITKSKVLGKFMCMRTFSEVILCESIIVHENIYLLDDCFIIVRTCGLVACSHGHIRALRRTISNTIVLTGLSGGGKTVLFYQLRDGSSHQGTVTSMEPNDEGLFVLNSETSKERSKQFILLMFLATHVFAPNWTSTYLEQLALYLSWMLWSFCQSVLRLQSIYLYDILTKASVVKKKIPLLILCNKVDRLHTKEFIRRQVEKEIDKLRTSRTALSDADIVNEFKLGVPGEAFSFSQCINKVTVADASALTGEIQPLEQFIREHVKP